MTWYVWDLLQSHARWGRREYENTDGTKSVREGGWWVKRGSLHWDIYYYIYFKYSVVKLSFKMQTESTLPHLLHRLLWRMRNSIIKWMTTRFHPHKIVNVWLMLHLPFSFLKKQCKVNEKTSILWWWCNPLNDKCPSALVILYKSWLKWNPTKGTATFAKNEDTDVYLQEKVLKIEWKRQGTKQEYESLCIKFKYIHNFYTYIFSREV